MKQPEHHEAFQHKPDITGDIEHEQEPEVRASLEGLALIRSDFGMLDEGLDFGFPAEVTVIATTGSRTWCVVEPDRGLAWREVLDAIPVFDYLVHSITIRMHGINPSVLAAEIRNRFRDLLTINYDNYSIFATNDEVTIVMNREHLDIGQATEIMMVAEQIQESVSTDSRDTRH